MKGAPFYDVYNVGDYTFQPWKVVWPEMSTRFYAAVAGSSMVPIVGSRPYVPDHKVYFAGFNNKEPAYFLCGLLNTLMVREWIESHTVSIQMGDVFKHMTLPEFNAEDTGHVSFAALVESSHKEHTLARRAILVSQIEQDGEAILGQWIAMKTPAIPNPPIACIISTALSPDSKLSDLPKRPYSLNPIPASLRSGLNDSAAAVSQ
jgi:hypothetical protein